MQAFSPTAPSPFSASQPPDLNPAPADDVAHTDVVRLVGRRACLEAHDLMRFLARNQVRYQWIDLDRDPLVRYLSPSLDLSSVRWPVCILPDGTVLEVPSRLTLAEKVGLAVRPSRPVYDLVIHGAGPAGLAAAVYSAFGGLRTVLLEREAPGGQAGTSSWIENFPGFPDGISGLELAERTRRQALRLGAEILIGNEVASIDPTARGPFVLRLEDGSGLRAHAALIATGLGYHLLDVPGLRALIGAGVHYGTALAEARFYQGGNVFVVGGGNSAGQTALHLAQHAERVTLLVRAEALETTMAGHLIAEIEAVPNIQVRLRAEVVRAEGTDLLTALVIADGTTGRELREPADGLFILIGQRPNTGWLESGLCRDNGGFVLTGSDLLNDDGSSCAWPLTRLPLYLETSQPGVFAVGDVRHGSMTTVASAMGEGATASRLIRQYVSQIAEADAREIAVLPRSEHAILVGR
jgi:thioredoxin reductase (NADPH)